MIIEIIINKLDGFEINSYYYYYYYYYYNQSPPFLLTDTVFVSAHTTE